MIEYIVHAPVPYSPISGGIRALYEFASGLRKRECSVAIGGLGPSPWTPEDYPFYLEYAHSWGASRRRDAVHVYPEYLGGNPAPLSRGVQWLLGPRRCTTDDLEFAWGHHLDANCERLTVDIIERDYFYPKTEPGNGTLWWRGNVPASKSFDGGREITCQWPATRKELGDVLRAADLLVCLEPVSAIITEATICGTPVVIPEDVPTPPLTMFGDCGIALGWDQLAAARESVQFAASHYQRVRDEIAHDIDRFIEITSAHFGG